MGQIKMGQIKNRAVTILYKDVLLSQNALSFGIALLMLGLSPLALASPKATFSSDAYVQAKQLFREGNQFFAKKEFEKALERFQRAKALYPSYKIEVNLGTTFQAMGRLPEAAVHFEQFLLKADNQAEKQKEQTMIQRVRSRLADLQHKIGRVELSCPVWGAKVMIDGKVVGHTPLHHDIYLNIGSYSLAVNKPGYSPFSSRVVIDEGAFQRLTVPWTAKEKDKNPWMGKLPAVKRSKKAVCPTLVVQRRTAKPFYKTWWFWTIVGSVVAGSAVAVAASQTGGDDRLPTGESGTIHVK
jgi:hypothetical protein